MKTCMVLARVYVVFLFGSIAVAGDAIASGRSPLSEETIVPTNLVLHYSFEAITTDTVRDESETKTKGIIKGATPVEKGAIGAGMYFNGKDAYVDAALPAVSGNAFTYALWVCPEAYGPEDYYDWAGAILLAKRGHYQDQRLNLTSKGNLQFSLFDKRRKRHSLISKTALPLNKYTHVVAVFDGKGLRLFIDGRLDASQDDEFEISYKEAGEWFRVGGGFEYLQFKGIIDEVMVFDRGLSSAEARSLGRTKTNEPAEPTPDGDGLKPAP